jgi:membrane-bound lytic murein transglycosylase MltF
MRFPKLPNPMAWILALALLPIVMPVSAQQVPAQQIPPQPVAREDLTIDPATVMQPRKGDLDEMIKRRLVRVLVVPNKTHYFMDKGTQRGGTYDGFRLIEQELNKKLEQEGKLGQKHLKVRFVFIPMGRERLLRALADGKGDIAAANLTVTPERLKLVDFTVPTLTNVSEVVITGPASPAIARLDDLAGKEIFVRKSSSYHESLVALNQRFAAEKKAAVILKEAPETLEDEDLIEMLNAGLVSVLIVDKHKADFWRQVFPKITVHDDLAHPDRRRGRLGGPQGQSPAQGHA